MERNCSIDDGSPAQVTYVLVEEEANIRRYWADIAENNGLRLLSFETPADFLDALARNAFHGSEHFYLDQDFTDRRGVGTELAGFIRRYWEHAQIRLITAYPKALFKRELASGLLNDVCGKYPQPFSNPGYEAFERDFEELFWAPLIAVMT